MAAVATCRFCLGGPDLPSDALLSPCACNGSCAYVHASCLLKWQHATRVPEHARRCQLCKHEYFLPGTARLEIYGLRPEAAHIRCMRSRPLVCSAFFYTWFALRHVYTVDTVYAAAGCLYVLTILYVWLLAVSAWERIENRSLYFRFYWVIYSGHPQHSPILDVVILALSLVCTLAQPGVGGCLYCAILPNLLDAHFYTVDRMNMLAL